MKRLLLMFSCVLMILSVCACSAASDESGDEKETSDKSEYTSQGSSMQPSESDTQENESPDSFDLSEISISIPYYEVIKEELHSSSFTYNYSNFVYNDEGLLIQKECSGDESYIVDYVYDEFGRLIEATETSTYYSSEGDKDIYTYTYDDLGNKVTEAERVIKADGTPGFRDGNFWEYANEYDENGRIIAVSYTNASADYENETVLTYEYDNLGRVVKETETSYRDNEKKSEFINTPVYDGDGNKIEERVEDVMGGSTWSNTWEYGETGSKEYSIANGYIKPTSEWVSFKEVSGLPTPDSCITAISSVQIVESQYLFSMPEDKKDSETAYFIYRTILDDYCDFDLMTDESGVTFITQDGVKLATMIADLDDTYNIAISFE